MTAERASTTLRLLAQVPALGAVAMGALSLWSWPSDGRPSSLVLGAVLVVLGVASLHPKLWARQYAMGLVQAFYIGLVSYHGVASLTAPRVACGCLSVLGNPTHQALLGGSALLLLFSVMTKFGERLHKGRPRLAMVLVLGAIVLGAGYGLIARRHAPEEDGTSIAHDGRHAQLTEISEPTLVGVGELAHPGPTLPDHSTAGPESDAVGEWRVRVEQAGGDLGTRFLALPAVDAMPGKTYPCTLESEDGVAWVKGVSRTPPAALADVTPGRVAMLAPIEWVRLSRPASGVAQFAEQAGNGVVAGLVVDGVGNPLANVEVLLSSAPEAPHSGYIRTALERVGRSQTSCMWLQTDSRGWFRTSSWNASEEHVYAVSPEWVQLLDEIPVPGTISRDAVIARSGGHEGHVLRLARSYTAAVLLVPGDGVAKEAISFAEVEVVEAPPLPPGVVSVSWNVLSDRGRLDLTSGVQIVRRALQLDTTQSPPISGVDSVVDIRAPGCNPVRVRVPLLPSEPFRAAAVELTADERASAQRVRIGLSPPLHREFVGALLRLVCEDDATGRSFQAVAVVEDAGASAVLSQPLETGRYTFRTALFAAPLRVELPQSNSVSPPVADCTAIGLLEIHVTALGGVGSADWGLRVVNLNRVNEREVRLGTAVRHSGRMLHHVPVVLSLRSKTLSVFGLALGEGGDLPLEVSVGGPGLTTEHYEVSVQAGKRVRIDAQLAPLMKEASAEHEEHRPR